jgi:hypothetical protein
MFNNKSELLRQTLSEGEIIFYCGKLCKVSLHRKGTLEKVKNVVELIPVKCVTVSYDTEVIDIP